MKTLFKSGDIFLWFTGAVLGVIILMVAGLLLVVVLNGAGVFWPSAVVEVRTKAGQIFMGEIKAEEEIPPGSLPENMQDESHVRIQLKIGNRDVYGVDFKWINYYELAALQYPADALCIERMEYGNMYGRLIGVKNDGVYIAKGDNAWPSFQNLAEKSTDLVRERIALEKKSIGAINYEIEQLRLRKKRLEFYNEGALAELAEIDRQVSEKQKSYESLMLKVTDLTRRAAEASVVVEIAGGAQKELPLSQVVRFYQPNQMGFFAKLQMYVQKVWEFLREDPRESNTEGGVFPAIFGTVLMVIIMTLAVVPFGVVAALYLREYANQGPFVRLTRIAVNNLAGVPSIVFGIFGLGFFVYFCGGSLDQFFFAERLPSPTWGTGGILWASLTLALLTVPVVIVATEEALVAVPRGARDGSLALGATKWQTTWRVVLPAATPGMLTGVILAMARGAGEVAPLMITGVVKLAPNLPLDGTFPFLHLDRKFMHLGFHIYDVGFQSPNVEAAKPMVFMTALLLILIVLLLNLTAIIIRARLRKKYQGSTF